MITILKSICEQHDFLDNRFHLHDKNLSLKIVLGESLPEINRWRAGIRMPWVENF